MEFETKINTEHLFAYYSVKESLVNKIFQVWKQDYNLNHDSVEWDYNMMGSRWVHKKIIQLITRGRLPYLFLHYMGT